MRVKDDIRNRLHGMYHSPRDSRMDDIERHDLNLDESLAGGGLHELVLSHGGLAARLPCPPPDKWYDVLNEHLRIPMICLKKENLSPWFKQLEQNAKVLLVL